MYYAQIKLPSAQRDDKISSTHENYEEKRPDNFIIREIFKYLHRNKYVNSQNYKYAIGFPLSSQKSLGRVMQVFANNEDELRKHIFSQGLSQLLFDYCNVKIGQISEDEISKSEKYSLIVDKNARGLPKSAITRLLKRQKEHQEILILHSKGLSVKDISLKMEHINIERIERIIAEKNIKKVVDESKTVDEIYLSQIDTPLTNNLFINYESILNKNLVYFHLKYAVGVQVSFILNSFNNFGFSKISSLPKLIF